MIGVTWIWFRVFRSAFLSFYFIYFEQKATTFCLLLGSFSLTLQKAHISKNYFGLLPRPLIFLFPYHIRVSQVTPIKPLFSPDFYLARNLRFLNWFVLNRNLYLANWIICHNICYAAVYTAIDVVFTEETVAWNYVFCLAGHFKLTDQIYFAFQGINKLC